VVGRALDAVEAVFGDAVVHALPLALVVEPSTSRARRAAVPGPLDLRMPAAQPIEVIDEIGCAGRSHDAMGLSAPVEESASEESWVA